MTDCKTCTERQGYYLDAETIQSQQEHIAELKRVNSEYMDVNHEQGMQLIEQDKRIKQLEARIAELARENAVLKQAPRHSDSSPRCPLRDSMTGEMGECDPLCAKLMKMNDTEQYRMCADALIARKLSGDTWVPVNYWNEVD